MTRFTVKEVQVTVGKRQSTRYAVYDTERCSYPGEAKGRRFEPSTDRLAIQALADEMNADPSIWPLPGRQERTSTGRKRV